MLIIGHRGAPSLEPENTIRSFKKAQELGVDMVEMDLRQSADGEIVISHDASLQRLFGIDKEISELSLASLKEMTIDRGREMATLAEALAQINLPVNLHIKVHGLEEKLISQVQGFPHKVLISSTFPGVLEKIKTLDGKADLGFIIGRGELRLLPIIRRLTVDLDLFSIHPKSILVSLISMPILKKLGKKIFVWTVNDPKIFALMARLKVDGIFTDCPQLFVNKKYD